MNIGEREKEEERPRAQRIVTANLIPSFFSHGNLIVHYYVDVTNLFRDNPYRFISTIK